MTGAYNGSKAQTGQGTVFSIGGPTGGTGTETFNQILEVMELPFKRPKLKMVDTTNLQSSIEEQIPVIPGLTSFTYKGNRVPNDAGQLAVETAFNTRTPYDFKMTLPINTKANQTTTGDSWTWSAYVLSSDLGTIKADSTIQSEVEIQYVTLPVFTAGA